jgi:hypothetical protein
MFTTILYLSRHQGNVVGHVSYVAVRAAMRKVCIVSVMGKSHSELSMYLVTLVHEPLFYLP